MTDELLRLVTFHHEAQAMLRPTLQTEELARNDHNIIREVTRLFDETREDRASMTQLVFIIEESLVVFT